MLKSSGLTPEELALCRKQLERRWKSRKVDESLLEQAWEVVHEVATVLYEEFGATQVAVFGSLAEPIGWTKTSDIDIAVWGLSDEQQTAAKYKVWDLKTGFKIDLINFDIAKGLFRERVQQQAVPIKKGEQLPIWKTVAQSNRMCYEEEIYEMNRKRLTQRINDKCVKIERTVVSIKKAIEDIEVLPDASRQYIEESIANRLTDVYSGIERIFERIANEVDGHLPRGDKWHKNLLEQMMGHRPERQPVISSETFTLLTALLEYRHKVNNIYADELTYQKTAEQAMQIENLFKSFSDDVNMFTESLVQHKEMD